MRQVLMNLVNNAIKFTAAGQVAMECELKSAVGNELMLRFEVTDTGIGIPAEALDRVFVTFSQADSSATRRFGGSGLGLSICKHLVQFMGGEIGVKSEVNRGTTFWVEIPFSLTPETGVPTSQVEEPALVERELRILIAEDNSVNQMIAIRIIEKMGHQVVVVANGREVLAAIESNDFNMILMDCQMPEMDGYEATQQIRSDISPRRAELPIIELTANAMRGDRERCGAFGCLTPHKSNCLSRAATVSKLTNVKINLRTRVRHCSKWNLAT